ncbi:MAG TPA: ELWxxDGT repeat protein [Candidatus Limnocylindrales bacterium]|nr:ELWxxDGT repeat protein [Candidatus Limnocylindrales bacterium]
MIRVPATRPSAKRAPLRYAFATTLLMLAFTASSVGAAVGPKMLKDVNVSGDAEPRGFSALGSSVLFSASSATHGDELWKTNGTTAGTKMLVDINPNGDSEPRGFFKVGTKLYFEADDGVHGRELWKTDGTAAGTKMVKDINAANGVGSIEDGFWKLGSLIFFYADDGIHGVELWKSDGTAKGTKMLKDIYAGSGSSDECCPEIVGGALVFLAFDGSEFAVWRSTGTSAGTTIVENLGPEEPDGGAVAGGKLFFVKNDGSADILFVTGGTSASTDDLIELEGIHYMAPMGSGMFFMGDDGNTGREPWFSDGTPGGTEMLADIMTGPDGSEPRPWNSEGLVGGKILFQATDLASGRELWATDGTPAGTDFVEDINPGPLADSGDASNFNDLVGGKLYFIVDDGTHGEEPWISDGTAAGTKLLMDIMPGSATSDASDGEVLNGFLYFPAENLINGREMWRTNGTPTGTRRVGDINPGSGSSNPHSFRAVGGTLYFDAADATHGSEPWKYVP